MKIAIVGTGISGLVAAHHLRREHEVTVFEAGDARRRPHAHGRRRARRPAAWPSTPASSSSTTGPTRTSSRCSTSSASPSQPSDMSFSVRGERSGLEYNGTSLNTLFAQRRNLLRPSFLPHDPRHPALQPRGAGAARRARRRPDARGVPAQRGAITREFVEHYLVPMGAAIWSADAGAHAAISRRASSCASSHNHGMLVGRRPPAVARGPRRLARATSRRSLAPLPRPHPPRTRRSSRCGACRTACCVERRAGGDAERFDAVVLACHSDQALRAAGRRRARRARGPRRDPLPGERGGAAHRRRAAAARARWPGRPGTTTCCRATHASRVAVTYNMNILQSAGRAATPFCVTLNRGAAIDPGPDPRSASPTTTRSTRRGRARRSATRARSAACSGTYFCGAYWGYGFHEDGVDQRARRRARSSRSRKPCMQQRTLRPGGFRHRRFAPRGARVSLPPVHDLPRPGRARRRCSAGAGCGRPTAPGARAVPPRRTTSATRRCRSTRRCATAWRSATGAAPAGPIRLLTHLRYFGYVLQPGQLLLLLRRRRRHASRRSSPRSPTRPGASATPTCSTAARLSVRDGTPSASASTRSSTSRRSCRWTIAYDWRFTAPGERLCRAHGRPRANGAERLRRDAGARAPRDHRSRRWRHALLALPADDRCKVVAAIYWQALRLWLQARSLPRPPERTA